MQNRHKTQNVTLHSHYKVTLLTIYNINISIPLISIKTKGKRENKKRESKEDYRVIFKFGKSILSEIYW